MGGEFEHHQFQKRSIYEFPFLSAVVVMNPTHSDVQYPYIQRRGAPEFSEKMIGWVLKGYRFSVGSHGYS